MDYVVNRESSAMRTFASQADNISDEFERVSDHLRQLLFSAADYMQDQSGRDAISILEDLVEETRTAVNRMRTLAEQVNTSAELLEESDTLL